MSKINSVAMIETFTVPDVFVTGLGEIEDLGSGVYRFIFHCKQHIGDREELVVVAKLIAPLEAVPPAMMMAARAVGFSFAKGMTGLHLH